MAVETGIRAAVEDMWWSEVSMVKRDRSQLTGKRPTLNVERLTWTGVSTGVIPV